ncbi:hypothetical protein PQX77_003064 [Marasmius sp. AFHP31]|nr:hypothetical protein PQX77_003064 [Marasmius sp. AFHP31]
MDNRDKEWAPRIMEMVDRSSCQLRSISISSIGLNEIVVENLLRIVGAQVTEITLEGHLSGYIFTRISDASDPLLPSLKHIKVVQEYPKCIVPCELYPPLPAVLDAAHSRQLSLDLEVYLDNPHAHMLDEMEIRRLRIEDGVQVGVTWMESLTWEEDVDILERLALFLGRRLGERLDGRDGEVLRNFPVIHEWLGTAEELINEDQFRVD